MNTTENIDFDLIHRILLEASQKAQDVTLKYFRKTIDIENKLQKGFDPVTAADKEAELAIRAVITDYFQIITFLVKNGRTKKRTVRSAG